MSIISVQDVINYQNKQLSRLDKDIANCGQKMAELDGKTVGKKLAEMSVLPNPETPSYASDVTIGSNSIGATTNKTPSPPGFGIT